MHPQRPSQPREPHLLHSRGPLRRGADLRPRDRLELHLLVLLRVRARVLRHRRGHRVDELLVAALHGGVESAEEERPRAVRLGETRDALVGASWASLPPGAHIATGSVRRRAQLAWHRPDLVFSELRGNIQTRLEKLESGGFDGIVMAAAAIDRLALDLSIPVDRLDPAIMLPQVAQGALAIECRADDTETIAVLRAIQHADTRRVVDTERAFLHELGGDCDLPAGAHATLGNDGIEITGMLATLDGRVLIRERRVGTDPDQLGRAVARFLLDERGGRDLLADLR